MTHHESRKRDARAARAISRGVSVAVVCNRHNIGTWTLAEACKAHGVTYPRKATLKHGNRDGLLRVIAGLQNGKTQVAMALELNVTRQAVSDVVRRCRKHGVNLNGAK